jgi:hypothetical protein
MTFVRNHFVALTAFLFLVAAVKAQPYDPLDQTRQDIRLKAQKMTAELNANFREAEQVKAKNPEKARDLLFRNRLMLNDDFTTLPKEVREDYLDMVNARLAALNGRADAQKRTSELAALRNAELMAGFAKLDAHARKALILGNPSASAVIGGAQKQYKDQAIAMLKFQEALQQQLLAQQKAGFYVPPKDSSGISKKEIALMRALASTLKVDFKGVPMKTVLEFLEEKTKGDLNFVMDELAFKAAESDPAVLLNDPVTKEYKRGLKVRALLHVILGERGMGYYIEDGLVFIAPKAKADAKLIVRSYPVTNLIGGPQLVAMDNAEWAKGISSKMQAGPAWTLLSQNIVGLVDQVTGTVEPDHWQSRDPNIPSTGPGSMNYVHATGSLAIRCSLEVHYLLQASGLLNNNKSTYP